MKNIFILFVLVLNLSSKTFATTPIISVNQVGTTNSASIVWGETDITISPGVSLNRYQIAYNKVGMGEIVIDNISAGARSYTLGGLDFSSSYDFRVIEVIRVTLPPTPFTPPFEDQFYSSGTINTTIVNANQPPVALCKNVEKSLDINCQSYVTISDANNGSYDPDFDALNLSITASGTYGVGTHYFMLNADDGKGGFSSCQFSFTIKDKTPPYIITKSEIVYLKENGKGYLQVSDVDNGTFDACSDHVKYLKPREYTCTDVGFHQIYLYARDSWGNLDSARVQIEVRDSEKPFIYNHDITLTLNNQGFVDFDWTKTDFKVYDNCEVRNVTLPKTRFVKSDSGTWANMTATDIHGNVQAHEFKVFVIDAVVGNIPFANVDVVPAAPVGNANITEAIGSTENKLFDVWPNPAINSTTISILDKEIDNARLFISKDNGLVEMINLINLKNNPNVQLDLSNYSVGSYLITVFTKNTRKTTRIQLVK